jgi:pyruvate/2-oxoglutarate dehydrogenase complex dihydrolipoamide dehydrogenase (E3) component
MQTACPNAAGRSPNLDGLDLEAAGIKYSTKGIEVDARLRSSNKRIFAIGDVAGALQFTHVAGYHAGIVIRNALFKLPAKVNYTAVPWVTYTDPEIANVGLTENQAKDRLDGDIRILRWPFGENDRAQAERKTDGFIKVISDRKGRIHGACIVGPHAGELILPWVLAVDQGLKIGAMASAIAPYPTRSEVTKRAAGSFYTASLFGDRTKTLVQFLLRL